MNRLLLYVHFNKNNGVSEHVLYQLMNIRPLFKKVVFISNSSLSTEDMKRIKETSNDVIERENIGFDFAAWRDGIRHVGWTELESYDSVTLMNDTCFGPIYSIKDLYSEMEKMDIDFWGITDHIASESGMPGNDASIPHHIQSYLTVYNKSVVQSDAYQNFWNNVQDYRDVEKVIQEYETQLTQILSKANYIWKVFFDTAMYSVEHKIKTHNYSELLPIVLMEYNVPLLKIKAFVHTPKRLIERRISKTTYPVSLIDSHLKSIHLHTVSYLKYGLKSIRILLRRAVKMIYNRANEH